MWCVCVARAALLLANRPDPSADVSADGHRAWWLYDPPYPGHADEESLQQWWQEPAHAYIGVEEYLDAMTKRWQEQAYEGIMGFSQGAAAVRIAELHHCCATLRWVVREHRERERERGDSGSSRNSTGLRVCMLWLCYLDAVHPMPL